MIMKMQFIRKNNGNMMLGAVIIPLVISTISSCIFEYMRIIIIANGVRDALESAVNTVSVENFDEMYSCLREGYAGGYELSNSGWQANSRIGDVYQKLDASLGLVSENGCHVKYSSGKVEFKISKLSVSLNNSSFAPNSADEKNKFSAESIITLEVPLSFGWDYLPVLKLRLKGKSGFVTKF